MEEMTEIEAGPCPDGGICAEEELCSACAIIDARTADAEQEDE